ncbi:MAG: ATP-binding cassette domain-containing protein [Planctomycetota bacterium]|nr:MAG: ATP-binding cassette domain-containing protein [Planctomycetota bacterium]
MEGEKVALVGPSGCGKTTLLHLIAGILPLQSGKLEVLGKALEQQEDAARRAFRIRRLGLVFQEFELLDYLTVWENLILPYRLHPDLRWHQEASNRAKALAESLGLSTLLHRFPRRLSQGERQRVAVGRALVTQPGLVLGDEPTGNLDPDNARRSLELLFQQCEAIQASLLVVTHDHSLLPRFDRTLELPALALAEDHRS